MDGDLGLRGRVAEGREGKRKRVTHKQYLAEMGASQNEYRPGTHTDGQAIAIAGVMTHDSRLRTQHSAFTLQIDHRQPPFSFSFSSYLRCYRAKHRHRHRHRHQRIVSNQLQCWCEKRISTSELASKPKRTVLLAECQMFAFFNTVYLYSIRNKKEAVLGTISPTASPPIRGSKGTTMEDYGGVLAMAPARNRR